MKLITTHKDYRLLVDEKWDCFTDFKVGQPYLYQDEDTSYIGTVRENQIFAECSSGKKLHWLIIAHTPLNNAPVLEGMLQLPEIENLNKYILAKLQADYSVEQSSLEAGVHFGEGYKAASQKKWTDADISRAFHNGFFYGYKSSQVGNSGKLAVKVKNEKLEELFQLLSPVPIGFEPEYEQIYEDVYDNPDDGFVLRPAGKRLKTSKTDKGEVLQGKYIYQ